MKLLIKLKIQTKNRQMQNLFETMKNKQNNNKFNKLSNKKNEFEISERQ